MRAVQALFAALVVGLFFWSAASASAAATPCADLFITAINVNPKQPVAGSPATISITVRNGGTCAAGGFVVQWKQDQFALTGPSKSVAGLAAGQSSTVVVSSDFTYPFPGNFLSIAVVDSGNAVSEFNEVNNLEIRSITVVPPTRNLTITQFRIVPQGKPPTSTNPVVRGRTATAWITIRNTGNSATGQFRVEWSPFFFATPLSRQVAGVGPGGTTIVTMDFTYPFDGTFFTTATVDTTMMVAETNEFDNQRSMNILVEPPLPDLEVTAFNVLTSPVVAGQPTTVLIQVKNTGNDPAGSFVVQWQPWFLEAPLTQQVNGLAVNSTATVVFTFTFPFALTFDGTIMVDSTGAVPEVSENNNTLATHIEAAAPLVDLTVTDLHLECGREFCSRPVQGELLEAVITVRNLGNAPSGSFVTEWNPDTFDIIPQGPHTVSQETGPLGPGASRVIRLPFTYPLAGNFRTIARVDAFNAVNESNETNNLRILNVVVDPAPIDLVITSFNVPANPVRGVPTTATITVQNQGPIATGDFFVRWEPQPNAFSSPTAFMQGLNPGESRTVSLEATYFDLGTFTTTATVDIFNQVVEPFGEGNNTVTKTVTVVPQRTTLDVTLQEVRVINDGDDSITQGRSAEWIQVFAVFKPGANCSLNEYGQSIELPDFECQRFRIDGVDSGETLRPNRTIRVTLIESTPLLAAYAAVDNDSFVVDFPDVRGFAFLLSFRPDYLSLGSKVIEGTECAESEGHCFDIVVRVTLVSTNVPSAASAAAAPFTGKIPTADELSNAILGPLPKTPERG